MNDTVPKQLNCVLLELFRYYETLTDINALRITIFDSKHYNITLQNHPLVEQFVFVQKSNI